MVDLSIFLVFLVLLFPFNLIEGYDSMVCIFLITNFVKMVLDNRDCCAKFATGLNIIISHSSKSMSD